MAVLVLPDIDDSFHQVSSSSPAAWGLALAALQPTNQPLQMRKLPSTQQVCASELRCRGSWLSSASSSVKLYRRVSCTEPAAMLSDRWQLSKSFCKEASHISLRTCWAAAIAPAQALAHYSACAGPAETVDTHDLLHMCVTLPCCTTCVWPYVCEVQCLPLTNA